MGWRPGDMGDSVRAGPDQEVPWRFLGARQHQRSSAEERTEENLQAAVTANVVEGAPHDGGCRRAADCDRARQARPCVHDHLRKAGRTRCEEDPFRLVASVPLGIGGRDPRTARDERSRAWSAGFERIPVGHERIHRGGRGDEGDMFRRQIGRAKNESPRDAVEFDERQPRRELIPGRDEQYVTGTK